MEIHAINLENLFKAFVKSGIIDQQSEMQRVYFNFCVNTDIGK